MKNYSVIFISILIICSINFFELQVIKGSFFRYIQFGYLLFAIGLAIPHILHKKNGFFLPVQLISFSIFLSIFVATLTRDQSLIDSIGGTVPVLIWMVFFYLNHITFSISKVERIIVGYGILYLLLYFFQFTHPYSAYFIKLETIDFSRGILRIVFPGRGLFYLTIFIAINKITSSKKNVLFWSLLSMMGIIVTIMQVTRQFIFGVIIIYLIHFLKESNLLKKIIILIGFVGCLLYVSQSSNLIVTSLIDTQEQNTELGSDYVRIQGAIFYLTEFSKLNINRFLGNGVPYGENSIYNRDYGRIIVGYGYWLSDVGIFAIYAMFGIFAVLGYCQIWLKKFYH